MRKLALGLCLLGWCAGTAANAGESVHSQALRDRLTQLEALSWAAGPVTPSEANTCVLQSIACGQTINGSLDPNDCGLSDGTVADFFQFSGTVGESVSATLTSHAFPPFLDLLDPTPTSRVFDGEPVTAQVQFVLDSNGLWSLGVTNDSSAFQTGNYTLSLTCPSSNANCTADATTLCLNSGRFKVRATFDAGSSGSGQAQVVALTGDTGYLWFFAASNVEAVVKVLNACGLGGHYWVFAGGLTNVKVVLTVTDTQTGATRTYTNPQNTVFQPIQDTSAFSTCP